MFVLDQSHPPPRAMGGNLQMIRTVALLVCFSATLRFNTNEILFQKNIRPGDIMKRTVAGEKSPTPKGPPREAGPPRQIFLLGICCERMMSPVPSRPPGSAWGRLTMGRAPGRLPLVSAPIRGNAATEKTLAHLYIRVVSTILRLKKGVRTPYL